jgi:hypothetical protein
MSRKRKEPPPPAQIPAEETSRPTIHEAEPASGPSGAVLRGTEIDFATAVWRRQVGLDVVVCGPNKQANSELAQRIEEAAVSPEAWQQEPPHADAGPQALPHYQPRDRPPAGHTFYETERRKARKKP